MVSKTSEERRNISKAKIQKRGIAYFNGLPLLEDSSQVELKSLDDICKRAIACLLSVQLASDIAANQDYSQSKELFTNFLKMFKVENELLPKEKNLFTGDFKKQDVIDVEWTYETYWSLVWALGLIDDIELANTICDCEKAITLVGDCNSFEEFKDKCKIRDIDEILDMLDLYYCYHWATVEKRINHETPIGELNPDVVIERRRGLEWLISNEDDWNAISLDT